MGILGVTPHDDARQKNLEIADILYNWIGRNRARRQRSALDAVRQHA